MNVIYEMLKSMKRNKGRIIIYGDTFRNNGIAQEIFAKSKYDDEQDEYFIVFSSIDDKKHIISELYKIIHIF